MDTISVLIPAYNEADRIGATIAAVRALPPEAGIAEIIVVDDGSTDQTAAQAEAAGADITLRQTNQGKGAALSAAFALSKSPIILLLDADLRETAAQALQLLKPIRDGQADMTIAAFPKIPGKRAGIGLVVRLARWGIRRLAGQTMQSPLSGQRCLRREVIQKAGGFASGWGAEVALTISALRADYRVTEVPLTMTHRVTGRSPADIRHRLAQFLGVAQALWKLARQKPATIPRKRE